MASFNLKHKIISALCKHLRLDFQTFLGGVESDVQSLCTKILKSAKHGDTHVENSELQKVFAFVERLSAETEQSLKVLTELNEELIVKSVVLGNGLTPSAADVIVFAAVHPFPVGTTESYKEKLPHLLRWIDYIQSKVEFGDLFEPILLEKAPYSPPIQMTMEETVPSSHKYFASVNEISEANMNTTVLPQERPPSVNPNKKLLVLDVNGLLAHIVREKYVGIPDAKFRGTAVFKRPFCLDFLNFCFTHFNVGIWTSREKKNADFILDCLLDRESKNKLLFCWYQANCTDGIAYGKKNALLKPLNKLWEMHDPCLQWERGQFNESNTLLLDDTPSKALCNPPHTAIFPESFQYTNTKDTVLKPGRELCAYLEGLAKAENVPEYVEKNPFGQRPITLNKPILEANDTTGPSSEATPPDKY